MESSYGYCNLNFFLKRRTGNVGIGTHIAQRTLHVEGDIFLKGMIYDGSNEPYALGGGGGGGTANLEWREAIDAPQFIAPPAVTLSNVGVAQYLQRFSGNENVFAIDLSAVVTSNAYLTTAASNAIVDYKLELPQEYDTRVYSVGARLGDLWLRASSNGVGNTFKAVAKVLAGESNVLALRYITGTADRPLTDVGVGWKIDLQGTLLYTTREFFTGLSLGNVVPASIVQDVNGNIVVNGGGFAPRGVLDVISTSNIPSFIVDLQRLSYSNTDVFQVKRNKVTKFAVHETGDVVIDGAILNANHEPIWLPGAAAEWRDAHAGPEFVLPSGAAFTYESNVGQYRYFGLEIHNKFTISGTLTSAASSPAGDFRVTLPYPLQSNLYPMPTILGNVWINVGVNGYLTTYQGYAETAVGVTNAVTIRYMNSIYNRSLGDFVAGSALTVRGDIHYHTNEVGLVAVSSYKPAVLRQDMEGRLMVTNTEAFPVGRFHIYENSDDPAFVVQQEGLGDMFQFRSNTSVPFVVDHSGNIGVGTTTPVKGLDIAGDMRISGAIYNDRNEAIWVPGSTLEWKVAQTPPALLLPAGCSVTTSTANASFRYVGDEVLYNVYLQGTVTANSGASGQDWALSLAYPIKTSAYANSTIVGDLWLNVSSNVTSTAFKAYARTYAGANAAASNMRVGLRYVNMAYDLPLTGIAVGSTVQLQGTIAYQTPLIANQMPVPVVYKYADFVQDLDGNVIFSGDGYAPQGRFEVGQNSNAPAFIVNQKGDADIVQVKRTNEVKVVVDKNGNVGIGTSQPIGRLHVEGGDVYVKGKVLPGTCNVYDLGSTSLRWKDLYLSGNTIDLGGTAITRDATTGGIKVSDPASGGAPVDMTVRNLTASNVQVIGDYVTLNTVTSNTEQVVVTNAGTGPALKVTQTGAQAIAEFYDDGGVLALKVADGGNVGIGTATPMATFHVNGSISSSGYVGIGLTNPSTLLHVGNYTGFSQTNMPPFQVIGTTTSTARFIAPPTQQGNVSTLQLWSTFQGSADNGSRYSARITSGFQGGNWGTEYLAFGVGNNGSANDAANNPLEHLRINGSGNVGIGTTNPRAKLHVEGNISVSGTVRVSGRIEVVHRRPIYNSGGGTTFTLTTTAQDIVVNLYGPYQYGADQVPVASGATRYYRIYGVYSDNITNGVNWIVRMRSNHGGGNIDYAMAPTYGGTAGESRDFYSNYSTSSFGIHANLQIFVNSGSSPASPTVRIFYLELQALDIY